MQITQHSEARVQGYKTFVAGEREWDIVSNEPTPAATVEKLMDMPPGETVEDAGREALKRLFDVVATDLRGSKRDPLYICRRILAIGHRVGSLREFTMAEIAAAMGTSRQAVCQASGKVEGLMGVEFAREPVGRRGGRPKS